MILCILKGISPFMISEIIFFPENLKKILGFTSKFSKGRVTLNTGILLFGLYFYFSPKKRVISGTMQFFSEHSWVPF